MHKKIYLKILLVLITLSLLLLSCNKTIENTKVQTSTKDFVPNTISSQLPSTSPAVKTKLSASVLPTSTKTDNLSPAKKVVIGYIKVNEGEMLERDIIPKICKVFSLTTQQVKSKMAKVKASTAINSNLIGFRRMEGIIIPGKYKIFEGDTLETHINKWLSASESRYNKFRLSSSTKNTLKQYQQIILASIIEAECLGGAYHKEVATVFLNRINDGAKLQSCVTAEYALGYQRPYLTGDDVSIKSNYNTYYISGLPVGPICSISDASLKAAIGKKMDSSIYFFYYDYILGDMFFFSDYTKFQKAGALSRERFEAESKVDKRAKINKQILY